MRNELCKTLIEIKDKYPLTFLTGDVGFMALEPLQEALGERFINAGVAEQNMVSVAAGLALTGAQAWVYSIAPFCYARPFEQIRNDICLNKLPVKLVGNGGGYTYGTMGGTHHALEDYGIMSTLIDMHTFIPAFSADVKPIVEKMAGLSSPCYLRLGRCELPQDFRLPDYSAWRCLLKGDGPLIVCMGPVVGPLLNVLREKNPLNRPEVWVATEFPLSMDAIPSEFLQNLAEKSALCVVEEHVAQSGFGQNLIWILTKNNYKLPPFLHAYAQGYCSETYGSQAFHRSECGLDPESILRLLELTEPCS